MKAAHYIYRDGDKPTSVYRATVVDGFIVLEARHADTEYVKMGVVKWHNGRIVGARRDDQRIDEMMRVFEGLLA